MEFTNDTRNYIEASLGATYTINEYLNAGLSYVNRSQTSDLGAASEFAGSVAAN